MDLLPDGTFRIEKAPVVICDCRRQEQEPGGPSMALTGIRVTLGYYTPIRQFEGKCRVCGTVYRLGVKPEREIGEEREALDIATAP